MRVGLYARISLDTAGQALGVGRQEADCRKLAELRNWEVVGLYVDNDVSAFKPSVKRPHFERLLQDLASGLIDGVCCYDLDRFARQPSDLERAIRIFDSRPLVFATVQSDLDLSASDGRTMARVLVAFANKASLDTSRRVKRKHLELAMNGVPVGGHRPFGYEKDKKTIKPSEAELIREAAKDLLAGKGLHTICRAWNEAGIKTTAGNLWRKQVLRTMMLSPRLAGYRVHQGGIAMNDGVPVTGLYEPILAVETWESVGAVLRDPARGKNTHAGGRKYLLAGIARCALCGTTLAGNADTQYDSFSYSCKSATNGGCGRVSISGPNVDAIITTLVLEYLAGKEVEQPTEVWSQEDELQAVTAQIQELMDAYGKRELTGDTVFPMVSKLETKAATLRNERQAWLRAQLVIVNRPTNATEAWPDLNTDQRRNIVQSVIQAVVIQPAKKRGGVFDPNRVDVIWR